MILYRPVSLQELALIYDSDMKAFPFDLPQQPIFYPVLDLEYARQTASDWNVKNGQFAGYVTQFKVDDQYIGKFKTHKVGDTQYKEFWIPADQIEEFNKHIVGRIKVVEAYFGDGFQGFIPDQFGLQGKKAVQQFTLLSNTYIYKRMDFYLEIKRNHKVIFLNYPFWQKHNFKNPGLKEKVIQAIREAWFTSFPQTPLVPPVQDDTTSEEQTDADPTDGPVEQDIKPVKPRVPQPPMQPAREDVTREQQRPSPPPAKPVHKDVTPAKQRAVQPPVTPVRKDVTPLRPREPQPPVKPVHGDAKPVEHRAVQPPAAPVRKDVTPVRPRETLPPAKPVHEDATPSRQTDSPSVSPLHDETSPARYPDPQVDVSPDRAETSAPRQKDLHLMQGITLGLSGNFREAVDELFRAVEEDPDQVVAQTSLGVACHRLGEEDRALACYENALKIDARYAEAHYFRANIFYEHGDVREAIAGYTIAVGLDPALIEAHQHPAPQDRLTDYTDFPAGVHRIAKPAYRILGLSKALQANPRQAELLKERAAEYSRLWNYEQAVADYSASLQIRPDDANVLYFRGLAYEQMGQHDRALEDYQQAVASNPQLPDVYINRGIEFAKAGNFHQSVASLTDAVRLVPQNPDVYFNRGITYFRQGEFERAVDDFSTVIRISPQDDAAYYWRGISHDEAGHQREAIADYRQFLALSQDPGAAQEIDQRLRRLNKGERNDKSGRTVTPGDGRKTEQVAPENQDQTFDLYGLIAALGERALNATWFGVDVNCSGETAEELYAFTDNNRPIQGRDLLHITSGIQQTVQGDFTAFDPNAASPWLFIRAWEGSGFYIEINDPKNKKRLKSHFPSVEEVEGVSPPYEGLFIHK